VQKKQAKVCDKKGQCLHLFTIFFNFFDNTANGHLKHFLICQFHTKNAFLEWNIANLEFFEFFESFESFYFFYIFFTLNKTEILKLH
jgi:hypothetical protein